MLISNIDTNNKGKKMVISDPDNRCSPQGMLLKNGINGGRAL